MDQTASLQTICSIQPFLLWTPGKVPPASKASRHTCKKNNLNNCSTPTVSSVLRKIVETLKENSTRKNWSSLGLHLSYLHLCFSILSIPTIPNILFHKLIECFQMESGMRNYFYLLTFLKMCPKSSLEASSLDCHL